MIEMPLFLIVNLIMIIVLLWVKIEDYKETHAIKKTLESMVDEQEKSNESAQIGK